MADGCATISARVTPISALTASVVVVFVSSSPSTMVASTPPSPCTP
eukprot:gene10662-9359_t